MHKHLLIILLLFNYSDAKEYLWNFQSSIGSCKLIIDDSEEYIIPKIIKISEGHHTFYLQNEFINFQFSDSVKSNEVLLINSDLKAVILFDKSLPYLPFTEPLYNYELKLKDETEQINVANGQYAKLVSPKDNIIQIKKSGFISIHDTLKLKPFFYHPYSPKLVETQEYLLERIETEEKLRVKQKWWAISVFSILDGFFIYQYLNPNDKSDLYYQNYFTESDIRKLESKYNEYLNEVDRVNAHKNLYLSAIVITSGIIIYGIFFESYTDLSEFKLETDSNISIKSNISRNSSSINFTINF